MAKYHINSKGEVGPCGAKERCPFGGESGKENHFDSMAEAAQAYENKFVDALQGMKKTTDAESANLPRVSVTAAVTPFSGGHYYGCHVSEASINAHLLAWRKEIGEQKADVMELNKANRDRGRIYHLTVVTPPEMKTAKNLTDFPQTPEIVYEGVGRAIDGNNEAWFVVCSSPEIAAWREANGLSPKDLHITIGFDAKDVHTQPKGVDSLVIS